jgi:hypothetical protein
MHITPSAELYVAYCPSSDSALRLVADALGNDPTTMTLQGWSWKRAHIIARCLRLLPLTLGLAFGRGRTARFGCDLSVDGSIPWVAESRFGMCMCIPYQYLPITKAIKLAMTEFSSSSGRAANAALDGVLTSSWAA